MTTEEQDDILGDKIEWDYTERIYLPSNMYFGFGSEIADEIYEYMQGNVRWCIFQVIPTWFIIKQEKHPKYTWIEIWTKQMNQSLQEAKDYAEKDIYESKSTKS